MTSKRNYRSMILQFRIAELQIFLETFGERNLKLRKKELQKRALYMLNQKKSRSVVNKITSLYKNMTYCRRNNDSTYRLRSSNDVVTKRRFTYQEDSSSPLYDDDYYDGNEFSDSHFNDYKIGRPLDLSENSSCLSTFENFDKERVKSVKFPPLPFFEHVSDIMLVTPLVPISESDALFEFRCTFALNSDALRYLFRCGDQNSKKYEAMFRLCLLNDELEVEDSLPQKLYLSINNRFCSCVPEGSISKHDSSGKRSGAPMNITPYIDRSLVLHEMVIHWSVSYHMTFAATIQLVRKRETEELIKNLVEKGEQDPAVSKKFIYDNLNDEDNEVAATSLKMSLICPLGKMLMTLPTRGTTCHHLQCFDGALYIKMNEIKSTWQCPVCNQTCLYENLFVDGYFMNILRSENFRPDIRDVQLSADGSWESVTYTTKKRPRNSSPVLVPEKKIKKDEETFKEILPISDVGETCEEILPDYNSKKTHEEVLPNSDAKLSEGSFVDDLKEIFSNIIDYNDNRSQYSEFSLYGGIFTERPDNETNSVSLSTQRNLSDSNVQDTSSSEKKIVLVDLTVSDSESDDDVRSLSSTSSSDSSTIFYIDRVKRNLLPNSNRNDSCSVSFRDYVCPSSSPPVYDIDSDGSWS